MKAVFAAQPYGTGTPYDLTDDKQRDAWVAELKDGEINDGGNTFGTVNLDFSGATDIKPEDIKTGPAGLPGTPWTPNTASPGPGSVNPLDLPAPPEQPKKSTPAFIRGDGALMPGNTSDKVGKQKLSDIMSGQSYPGSDVKP